VCLAGITFTLVRRHRYKKRAAARRAQAEYEKEHALQIAAHKAEEAMAQALLDQANALELKIKKRAMAYPENWSVSCMRAQHSVPSLFFWAGGATTRSGQHFTGDFLTYRVLVCVTGRLKGTNRYASQTAQLSKSKSLRTVWSRCRKTHKSTGCELLALQQTSLGPAAATRLVARFDMCLCVACV
jgi:hypothetical protein